jgi:hypothetical protein
VIEAFRGWAAGLPETLGVYEHIRNLHIQPAD